MTAQLLFHKPENPKQFLIRALEAAKTQQGTASLLTESDFRTMYHMFDLTKRGAITREQAQAALKSVMGPTASFEKWQIDVPELLREDVFVSAMLQVSTHPHRPTSKWHTQDSPHAKHRKAP